MEKKIAGIVGAVAALGAMGSVQATPTANPADVLHASSYADLLKPVQNAQALLQAIDDQQGSESMNPRAQLAQADHHHHHHHAQRPAIVIKKPHRHHHHHHHHHHNDH